MKYYILLLTCISFKIQSTAQTIQLTDHLIFPRLDSAYWEKDFDALNANQSSKANKFQVCTFTQTDSTRGRFCFNTTMGQVQLDTTLHNIPPDKLIGTWNLTHFGTFEVVDSMVVDQPTIDRQLLKLKEYNNPSGTITFTNNKLQLDFKNIDEYSNEKGSYQILDGKYLVTKKIAVKSASTIVALTKDGFLILDDHTYRTLAQKDRYLVVRTRIRRMILKKA
ncbi:hypothetical protein A3860_20025 [Niastella vici]|uniref:Uncharacterized protein n=1 Tax=Niastella vici TaxID=1703345 RepID=A0A1V9G1C7_9BACT|nr:hypothetical protein [Niastella vici]OQP64266.1 hypothetical protein A3860_20025 [Niastella vici]